MLRIAIDARPALATPTGVGVYVRELCKALNMRQDLELVALTASWKDDPERFLDLTQVRDCVHVQFPVRLLNFGWHYLGRPRIERFVGDVDVAHSPHPLTLPSRRAASVITIHDLDFLHHPERSFREVRRDYPRLVRRAARRAAAVLTDSEASRNDILEHLECDPSRVHAVPLAVDQRLSASPAESAVAAARQQVGEEPFLLFVGRLEPRKNLDRILRAFAASDEAARSDHRLVLCGPAADEAEAGRWRQLADELGVASRIAVTGYVPRDVLHALYHGATALLMPSLAEGFGLPVLEAMVSGCPVITSTTTSLPEVAGDAALLVDPEETDEITAALDKLLCDSGLREDLTSRGKRRASQFTWAATASKTVSVYESVLDHD